MLSLQAGACATSTGQARLYCKAYWPDRLLLLVQFGPAPEHHRPDGCGKRSEDSRAAGLPNLHGPGTFVCFEGVFGVRKLSLATRFLRSRRGCRRTILERLLRGSRRFRSGWLSSLQQQPPQGRRKHLSVCHCKVRPSSHDLITSSRYTGFVDQQPSAINNSFASKALHAVNISRPVK